MQLQSTVLLLGGLFVLYQIFAAVFSLRRNIAAAKASSLNYIITPCTPFWLPWLMVAGILIPIIKLLPESWWNSWLPIMTPDVVSEVKYDFFAKYGDAFFVVSPYELDLRLASAEAISHLMLRREQFPKALEHYRILRQFGDNVITTEGALWRLHRKTTSATFNEKNAALVFKEAAKQSEGLCRSLMADGDGYESKLVRNLEHQTMKLALHIISYVGFGIPLLWPGEGLPPDADPHQQKYASLIPSEGHQLSFVDTMTFMLEYIFLLLVVPWWILRLLPFKKSRLAETAAQDFLKYMNELIDEKSAERSKGERSQGMDLVGELTANAYGSDGNKTQGAKTRLGRDEIIGNAFVLMVAGHETTANTLHFALLHIAANPALQRKVQEEIDELVGDEDPSTWNYEELVNPLMGGIIGACMNETLRLLPAVVGIPKMVTEDQDQYLPVDGRQCLIKKATMITICAPGAHNNPKYWPTRPSKIHPGQDDLADFVPERWFLKSEKKFQKGMEDRSDEGSQGIIEEDFGGYQGRDTSAQLFRPERGAFIPFSDGPRSCLGRRIAQVEIVAALAVIFRDYSLELGTDDILAEQQRQQQQTKESEAGNEEATTTMQKGLEDMSRENKRQLYAKAQRKCLDTIDQATTRITLKLHGDLHVPVRMVKRGEERFVNWLD